MIKYHRPYINTDYSAQLLSKIKSVLDSGKWVNDKYINKLEQYFIDTYNVKYAIACASCTAGLLAVVDVVMRRFDERLKTIGIPSFTWWSTWYAATKNMCLGVPLDIDKETWLTIPDYQQDAMIVVDAFGNKMPKLETEIPVIYDAAHGFGLSELGNRGIAEVVSFSYTKVITSIQGGMILTNSEYIYKHSKELVDKFYKMTELDAVLCLQSLETYNERQLVRKEIVNNYKKLLGTSVKYQKCDETNNSVFGILFDTERIRDRVAKALTENNIEYKIYYIPVSKKELTNTKEIYDTILCLPVYPEMSHMVEYICSVINEVLHD
jgi:dTDP-4-amino-4,6-dideoxygalactose transaminase